MNWNRMKELKESSFRRLTGVSRELFARMVRAALEGEPRSTHPKTGGRRGPKPKLCPEDRLLMLLMYYREYRTFAHIGADFGVSEAQSWRIITGLEERLIKDGLFHLTRKQRLRSATEWTAVVVDAGEHPVERPQKNSGGGIRAKRNGTPLKARC